jgi:hypothetical protein
MVIDVVCMLETFEIVSFTPRVPFIQGNMYPIQIISPAFAVALIPISTPAPLLLVLAINIA